MKYDTRNGTESLQKEERAPRHRKLEQTHREVERELERQTLDADDVDDDVDLAEEYVFGIYIFLKSKRFALEKKTTREGGPMQSRRWSLGRC